MQHRSNSENKKVDDNKRLSECLTDSLRSINEMVQSGKRDKEKKMFIWRDDVEDKMKEVPSSRHPTCNSSSDSLNCSFQKNCGILLTISFSDSEPEDYPEWTRSRQQRRNSFKATKSKRIEMDRYEPENLSTNGSQSSLFNIEHIGEGDLELIIPRDHRRMSSVSAM